MLKYIGMLAGQLLAATPLAAQGPGDSATVRLSVRHAGAPLPGAMALRLRAAQPDTAISVELEALAEELEELIVSSTRSDRRIEEQPLRVEVLAREEGGCGRPITLRWSVRRGHRMAAGPPTRGRRWRDESLMGG